MSEYGLKPTGPVIKRLDTIISEIHDDCSAGWDVNTRLNPKSFFNVLITAFGDRIAGLWDFALDVYYSGYPSSADGISLDYAGQFGGSMREAAAKTFYPIHCECVDGTVIPAGTTIKSTTNPEVLFAATIDSMVSRLSFNRAKIRILALQANAAYTVAVDGSLYSYPASSDPTEQEVLSGLSSELRKIPEDDFVVRVEDGLLVIDSAKIQATHTLVLSGNLTTESVTGIVNFASETYGEVALPDRTITQIVTTVIGLKSCVNLSGYIPGRLIEKDSEFRRSYAEKIFGRSAMMLSSIKSAILLNVQGAESVAAYENDTEYVDGDGRWPHCIEIVVDGGRDADIAMAILSKKAGGILTFGSVEVMVPGEDSNLIPIRFNRPAYVYVWFRVIVTMGESLPSNYVDLVKAAVLDQMNLVEAGTSIIPQKFLAEIYRRVAGIAHVSIPIFYTEDIGVIPGSGFEEKVIPITARQRAVTSETRIEVLLDG